MNIAHCGKHLLPILFVTLPVLVIITFFILGMLTQGTSHVVTAYSNYGP